MRHLTELFRLLGALLGLSAFACTLTMALIARVDPLWAIVRALAGWAAVLVIYTLLCRLVIPLFGIDTNEAAREEPA